MRSWLFWCLAVLVAAAFTACDNPFDPLNSSDKIQGLTYFDFTASQAHWDSDPEWDGVQITMAYYNEFGDQLNFHDKPHKVQIEFYAENTGASGDPVSLGTFLTSKTIEFSNSDDLINVPIEFYGGALAIPSVEAITGCLVIHVFPPEEYPQKELLFPQCGVELFTPEPVVITP